MSGNKRQERRRNGMPVYGVGVGVGVPSGMLLKVDRRVGAGAEESLGQILPGGQLAARTPHGNRCREPSVVPD